MSDCCILFMDDLNTSDYLPLLVFAPCQEDHMEGAVSQRIDWDQARWSGEMVDYMNTVKSHLAPHLNTSHESVQDVDQELKYVARVLCDAAEKTLPLIQPRKPRRWKDDTLTALCAQSRSVHKAWKDAGCPCIWRTALWEKGRLCWAVRRRVRFFAAKPERIRCLQLGHRVVSDCLVGRTTDDQSW